MLLILIKLPVTPYELVESSYFDESFSLIIGVPQEVVFAWTPFVKIIVSEHFGSEVQSLTVALNVYTPFALNPVTLATPLTDSPMTTDEALFLVNGSNLTNFQSIFNFGLLLSSYVVTLSQIVALMLGRIGQ